MMMAGSFKTVCTEPAPQSIHSVEEDRPVSWCSCCL
jgi:hypothetical protein